ncbi:hypothetical protein AAFF_G00414650 [Aldrovandia affinis]|uniref:Uncharacterized protein n=1 Tax=Aldrovandia affinis TaxID=143900 RepID=A0AAD7WJ95_9TELE|nr:hypothetical protein AAFF_G00414650 [Aldrovandia affinis]
MRSCPSLMVMFLLIAWCLGCHVGQSAVQTLGWENKDGQCVKARSSWGVGRNQKQMRPATDAFHMENLSAPEPLPHACSSQDSLQSSDALVLLSHRRSVWQGWF